VESADLTAICDGARISALYDTGFARHTRVSAGHLDAAVTRYRSQRFTVGDSSSVQ
jgi:hypothetical protein